ncbi:MAG: hypothetical protein GY703_12745 [Gammaproteobacteria bacterium]|nr:hypothetical protein [Gammaproteobacteria bacterium]
MPRGLTGNLILILATLLGLLIWLGTPPPEETPPRLTLLEPSLISRMELRTPDGRLFGFRKAQDGWWMTQPRRVIMEDKKIAGLLEIATTRSTERFPVPEEERDQFGLEPPAATLRLDEHSLFFGGTHPIDHRRYVLSGDTLHLIKDRFALYLLSPEQAFGSLEFHDSDTTGKQ